MFDHSSFKSKPVWSEGKTFFSDTMFSYMCSKGRNGIFLVRSFLSDVSERCIFPSFLNNTCTDFCCDRSTASKSLRSNPIWSPSFTEHFHHVGLDCVNFFHGFLFSHWSSIWMSASTNDDSKSITSMISESYFLMCTPEYFDDDIVDFNVCNLELRCIDHKELGCDRTLILRSCKKDTVARNSKFLG